MKQRNRRAVPFLGTALFLSMVGVVGVGRRWFVDEVFSFRRSEKR
jgi:hypothetical protein